MYCTVRLVGFYRYFLFRIPKMVVETGLTSVEQEETSDMQNRDKPNAHDRGILTMQDKGMAVLQDKNMPKRDMTSALGHGMPTALSATDQGKVGSPTVESNADMPTVEEEPSEAMRKFLSHQTFYTQGFVRCEGFLMPRCFLRVS
jgi:hypothetical protein